MNCPPSHLAMGLLMKQLICQRGGASCINDAQSFTHTVHPQQGTTCKAKRNGGKLNNCFHYDYEKLTPQIPDVSASY